ncbi:hypothetical protein [Halosegnis longus]|uniref:hypothetical protein n=1 Tax=Halosegnis longus TaxID=2216012 RepID=UPI00129E680F|nr:hypothetical protein [Halosegnis longus]
MSFDTVDYAGVGTATLTASELTAGESHTIHGIAIAPGDVTHGKSGDVKVWTAEGLEMAAETLANQPLVRDHRNTAEGKVGTVTEASFAPGVGVIYEAEIAANYAELAEDVQNGVLEVSVRALHPETEHLEQTEEGYYVVDELVFDNLSLVTKGASPSNTANPGSHPQFDEAVAMAASPDTAGESWSTATLARPAGDVADVEAELDEHEMRPDFVAPAFAEGDMVQWQVRPGLFGRVDYIHRERKVLEVSIYEEMDGELVYTGHTLNPAYTDVVHMDDDDYPGDGPGEQMDGKQRELDGEEEASGDYGSGSDVPDEYLFETKEAAMEKAREMGLDDVHEMDGMWMPGGDHSAFTDAADLADMSALSSGTQVMWETQGSPAYGKIRETVGDDGEVTESDLTSTDGDGDSTVVNGPAAIIVQYEAGDDGWDARTTDSGAEFTVAHELDALTVVDSFEENALERAYFYDAELADDDDELDQVYSDWSDAVNMTASSLETWSEHPCADEGSTDPSAVRKRNMNLLTTDKSDWGSDEISDAKRTISFIERMSASENKPDDPKGGNVGTCPSEWAISLLNWAYNPFDSMPGGDPDPDTEENSVNTGDVPMDAAQMSSKTVAGVTFIDTKGGKLDESEIPNDGFEPHYLFPAENKSDSSYPVVDSDGMLRRGNVEAAHDLGARGGVSDSELSEKLQALNGEFDDQPLDEEEMSRSTQHALPVASVATLSSHDPASASGQGQHSNVPMKQINYQNVDEEELESLEDPVVVESEELEALSDEADGQETIEEELSELREKFDDEREARERLDELDEEHLEAVEDADEPVVLEAETHEELESLVEETGELYAEELAGHTAFSAEELMDRFRPMELADKVEDTDGASIADELSESDPSDPKGGSAESEELEEISDDGESEELAQKREAFAQTLEANGWEKQAEELREGEIDLDDVQS